MARREVVDRNIGHHVEAVISNEVRYLARHPEIEKACSKTGSREFFTTDSTEDFDNHAASFYGAEIKSKHIDLEKSV